jgi:hypothetical protein
MDPKVNLLREFYRGLPKDRAKVETEDHGFAFLAALLADGATLEYGELTLSGLLHKYKLAHLSEGRLDGLLRAHVEKACNVCLYFDGRENDLFCFNLDNNHKTDNTVLIPEMELAVRVLGDHLRGLGCDPLVVASGRGYHLWVRLNGAVANERLYDFMLRSGVVTVAALHAEGHDYHRIKLNFYPDPRIRDVVSLRLFGSQHAKTKRFSQILSAEGLLDEAASWKYFADHLRMRTVTLERFDAASDALAKMQ